MSADAAPLRFHVVHAPKAGNTEAEYEDAFAALPERGRFAVADGASESSFAQRWAELLVQEFVARPWKSGRDEAWLGPLQKKWAGEVDALALPWYAAEKRAQGAYATFLGLVLKPGRWLAIAVGDCCLFHLRGGELQRLFPMQESSEFSNRPALLCSRQTAPLPTIARAGGTWRPGDRFFAMSDALAHWFLYTWEQRERPWEHLAPLVEEGPEFRRWLNEKRDSKAIRNDDVTLLTIDP
jgi:hypothetical protein